jgi:hypothetical protein
MVQGIIASIRGAQPQMFQKLHGKRVYYSGFHLVKVMGLVQRRELIELARAHVSSPDPSGIYAHEPTCLPRNLAQQVIV